MGLQILSAGVHHLVCLFVCVFVCLLFCAVSCAPHSCWYVMHRVLVARRWGEVKWFCSRKKSLVGSAAFAVGAFVSSYALLTWLHLTSSLTLNIRSNLPSLALITALTTLSELIPCIDDNLTVPAVAALTSWSLLRPSSPSSPK